MVLASSVSGETALSASVVVSEPLSVEEQVTAYFSDVPVMIDVARCESRFRHTLKDGSVIRGEANSADIGVMQINEFYHRAEAKKLGLNIDILADNMVYARKLFEKEGTTPWLSSSKCWGKHQHISRK